MEYSDKNAMSRKDYLKSKQKGKFGIRTIKYILIVVVIVLLSIYLWKQLNIYNNVTKIANQVLEETALAKTLKMYYVSEGYTKDSPSVVTLYKATDESRVKIEGSENFNNIKLIEDSLYGLVSDKLYSINISTLEKTDYSLSGVKEYIVKGNKVYYYATNKDSKKTGIYVLDKENGKTSLVINAEVTQFVMDDMYIFVVTKGKTAQSIVRYNINGSGRTVLTNKEIVSHIMLNGSNVYFVADELLYKMSKTGKDITKLTKDKVYLDADIKKGYSLEGMVACKNHMVYYISKTDKNVLCTIDTNKNEKQSLTKKAVESVKVVDHILYFKLNSELAFYKVNLETGKMEQVTSIRGKEYICIN